MCIRDRAKIKQNIELEKTNIIQQGPKNKKFWKTLRSFTNPTEHFQTSLRHNGQSITTPQDKANAFAQFFAQIFTADANSQSQRSQHFHHKIRQELPKGKDVESGMQMLVSSARAMHSCTFYIWGNALMHILHLGQCTHAHSTSRQCTHAHSTLGLGLG